MKPDWKDAPEWAQWVAMDPDGSWWWFEKQPKKICNEWQSVSGQYLSAYRIDSWVESLMRRPETSGTTSGGAT